MVQRSNVVWNHAMKRGALRIQQQARSCGGTSLLPKANSWYVLPYSHNLGPKQCFLHGKKFLMRTYSKHVLVIHPKNAYVSLACAIGMYCFVS